MTTSILILRLEQIRAHLDVEHKHLVDQVYEALASGDTVSPGSVTTTAPTRISWNNVSEAHRFFTKVDGGAA